MVLGDWWKCLLRVHEFTLRMKEAVEGSAGAVLVDWARKREVLVAQAQSLAEELRALIEVEPVSEWRLSSQQKLQETRSLIESLLSMGEEVMIAVQTRQEETWQRLKALGQGRRFLEGYRSHLGPEGRLVDLRESEG